MMLVAHRSIKVAIGEAYNHDALQEVSKDITSRTCGMVGLLYG